MSDQDALDFIALHDKLRPERPTDQQLMGVNPSAEAMALILTLHNEWVPWRMYAIAQVFMNLHNLAIKESEKNGHDEEKEKEIGQRRGCVVE